MMKDMRRLPGGKLLLAVLAFLAVSCRNVVKDPPPKIEVCILDGHGGGDCVESDGSKLYKTPSEMLNYWSTSNQDEANFSAWCYQTNPKNVRENMNKIMQKARD